MTKISEFKSEQSTQFETHDSHIDFSEIPEWSKEDFANSKQGLFYRPNSKLVKSVD